MNGEMNGEMNGTMNGTKLTTKRNGSRGSGSLTLNDESAPGSLSLTPPGVGLLCVRVPPWAWRKRER